LIRHIILIKFKSDADQEDIRGALEAIRELQRATPGIEAWKIVEDVGQYENSYAYALIADFVDKAAVDAYQYGAAHAELGKRIGGFLDSVAGIDYLA
jgi:quinol monooxygenase YgiN